MPIVFEEVTGEIAPEREPPQDEAAPPTAGERIAETVRREIHLMVERARRLRAD
jgi:hypothetical protein